MIVFVDMYCGCGGMSTGFHEACQELGGRCEKERTAFKCYHIKGCFVEVEKTKR